MLYEVITGSVLFHLFTGPFEHVAVAVDAGVEGASVTVFRREEHFVDVAFADIFHNEVHAHFLGYFFQVFASVGGSYNFV